MGVWAWIFALFAVSWLCHSAENRLLHSKAAGKCRLRTEVQLSSSLGESLTTSRRRDDGWSAFPPLQRRLSKKMAGGRMLADLRDAVRQLRKVPGFTTTALITLALGIGATTAIFTLVHQVMLKSLPVTKPGELWRIKFAAATGAAIPRVRTGILRCSRGRLTGIFARRRRSSRTWQPCRPAMRLLACAERGQRHRRTRAMGSMCPEISSGPLACSRGSAA